MVRDVRKFATCGNMIFSQKVTAVRTIFSSFHLDASKWWLIGARKV